MNITDIKKQQSIFETFINRLQKMEARLQYCYDEDWDEYITCQFILDFLQAYVDLKEAIEEEYGDCFPHLLGIGEQLESEKDIKEQYVPSNSILK